MTTKLPVAVLGAGPVGLAAAAHLVERDQPFMLFESGGDVGAAVSSWGHVRLFSPWRFNIDPAARRLLDNASWEAPDESVHPTGADIVEEYLRPLAALPQVAPSLRLRHKVVGVARAGIDKLVDRGREERPFVVTVEAPHGRRRVEASAVIDATGTWRSPNPLGADGFEALGEGSAAARVFYGIPDVLGRQRDRYAGRRVAVVGSGHSAQNAVRDLAELQLTEPATAVAWVVRRPGGRLKLGGGTADQLPERSRLGSDARRLVELGRVELEAGFRIEALEPHPDGVMLLSVDGRTVGPFDQIVAATGFRPDLSFLRELRLDLDPSVESSRALAPLIDPNVHSCGSVPPHGQADLRHPESGVYLVGAKSYGRAPTFLLATGYEQVRSVVAYLAGDFAAARRLELILPETGVCSSSPTAGTAPAGAGCCGSGPASESVSVEAPVTSGCCDAVVPAVVVAAETATPAPGGCCAPAAVPAAAGAGCCG